MNGPGSILLTNSSAAASLGGDESFGLEERDGAVGRADRYAVGGGEVFDGGDRVARLDGPGFDR
jgi:hypothetical protein